MKRSFARWGFVTAALVALVGNAAGCGGSDGPLFPTDPGVGPSITAAPGGMRQLLKRQYVNTVGMIFGDHAVAALNPPNPEKLYGLRSIGAAELAVAATDVEDYELSARKVATAVVSDPKKLEEWLPCKPTDGADKKCLEKVVKQTGRLAWRRSLSSSEVDAVVALGLAAGKEYGTFEQALRYAIIALLQAPDFIYVIELGETIDEGDTDFDPNDEGRRRLTPLELVTRMSLFLTDSSPPADLLDAAEAGDLDTEEQRRSAAEQLLNQPQAKEALRSFYGESLFLEELETKLKDSDAFPDYDAELAQAMRTEVEMLIEDVVWTRDTDFRTIIISEHAFVNKRLAELYGLEGAEDLTQFERRKLKPEQSRVGFLGSAAFNTIKSHPGNSSPTKRGTFIHSHLLCAKVPPPPADVDTTLPDDDPDKPMTVKQKLDQHMKDPSCAPCHARIDPPGYALETFDAIGRYRAKYDNGLPIDTSGITEDIGEFLDAKELAERIHDNDQFANCMMLKVYRNAMGRLETGGEAAAIKDLGGQFKDSDYRMQKLLVDIVASRPFRLVGDPK